MGEAGAPDQPEPDPGTPARVVLLFQVKGLPAGYAGEQPYPSSRVEVITQRIDDS